MSKKYFGTDGIRGAANSTNMNAETALKAGSAAGSYFNKGGHRHKVVIGKDTRLSGYMVEQALASKVRRTEDVQYQHLAMTTVADGVVEGVCDEIMKRKLKLKVRQADRLANELEFLKNTLKKFLGDEAKSLLDSTLHMVSSKAGRGRDYQGNGPDGLAAIEELERLGRVYVLCLGD